MTVPADAERGDLVAIGSMLGVAMHDAETDGEIVIVTKDVYELPAVAADVWAAGDTLYRCAAAGAYQGKLTDTAGSNLLVGATIAAKAVNAASARVWSSPWL